MKSLIINILFVLITISFFSCSDRKSEEPEQKMEMKDNTEMPENHGQQMKAAENSSSELVREGVIDVESIDKNKDGNLFECPMDWNVINDEKGNCPVCGMKLKEYTIAEVKENLDKYDYDYKN